MKKIIALIAVSVALVVGNAIAWNKAFAGPLDVHNAPERIGITSHALDTNIDKDGNVTHSFRKVESEIVIKGKGVQLVDKNLNSAFGPKIHPITGKRRPICNSSDFYANEKGLLTCNAIAEWAAGK